MTANETRGRVRGGLKLHGQAGLLIILLAEALLFSGNQVVGRWFTPIVWTGYILFIDALVYKLRGESLLVSNLGNIELFEMPVLGYLGFPFFAVETWVMYVFVRGWVLGVKGWNKDSAIVPDAQPPTPNPQPPPHYAR